MRRPLLVSLMVLGLVVTAVGGMGVFAPFTDRATTGLNTVSSGARAKAVDLRLAFPVSGPAACATTEYADNLTTAGLTASDVQPGFQKSGFFCLRNVGSGTVNTSVKAFDVVDIDTACTGDEAEAGDTTCGENGAGELAKNLFINVSILSCSEGSGTSQFAGSLAVPTTISLAAMGSESTLCGSFEVFYPLNRTQTEVLLAQSDTVTWRFAFDGVLN